MNTLKATATRTVSALRGDGTALRIAAGLAVTATIVLGTGTASAATKYHFVTLDNNKDPNFNQLLGINSAEVIVGYDGDGTVKPNKGYVLVPEAHYSDENFPKSVQTQVTGINNLYPSIFPFTFAWNVGFWVDGSGNNNGWANVGGKFADFNSPNAKVGTAAPCTGLLTDQLLGINNTPTAVGFYLDAACNSHGYQYDFTTKTYSDVTLPFKKVASSQATGINDSGIICGFFVDSGGKTHGYYGPLGALKQVDVPASLGTGTTFLGINDNGILVGFVTKGGVSHGLIYDSNTGTATIVNDPDNSSKAAFGVSGTIVNGVNDNNEIVGFFSDGTKVHGFFAAP